MSRHLPEPLTIKLPSVTESVAKLMDQISTMLDHLGLPDNLAFDVKLACEEAIVNAVEHGNQCDSSKMVHLECSVENDVMKVVVRDEGEGFDPAALPDPTEPENILREDGRGVFLIRRLVDEVRFNEKGNEITIIKRLPPA